MVSSSVHAGLHIQLKAAAEKAAEYISPRMDGYDTGHGKKAKKFGCCLARTLAQGDTTLVERQSWNGGIPMGQPRHDLILDVLLDVFPRFPILGSLGGQYLPEIAWFYRRDHGTFLYSIEVTNN